MAILVTGAAGFIGATLSKALLDRGDAVVGLDSLNDYYDVALKRARLERLEALPTFTFERGDIVVRDVLPELFNKYQIHAVIHLAAQAGVVIPWKIQQLILMPIWWVLAIYWKRFGKRMESHWFTHHPVQFTAPMTSYPFQNVIVSINLCPCMRRLSDRTN